METTILLVQRLSATSHVPFRPASPRKLSFDLCSTVDAIIPARGHAISIPVFSPERIPPGFGGRITSRTSLAAIECLRVIDEEVPSMPTGHNCEVSAILQNNSDVDLKIRRGDRVAQFIVDA